MPEVPRCLGQEEYNGVELHPADPGNLDQAHANLKTYYRETISQDGWEESSGNDKSPRYDLFRRASHQLLDTAGAEDPEIQPGNNFEKRRAVRRSHGIRTLYQKYRDQDEQAGSDRPQKTVQECVLSVAHQQSKPAPDDIPTAKEIFKSGIGENIERDERKPPAGGVQELIGPYNRLLAGEKDTDSVSSSLYVTPLESAASDTSFDSEVVVEDALLGRKTSALAAVVVNINNGPRVRFSGRQPTGEPVIKANRRSFPLRPKSMQPTREPIKEIKVQRVFPLTKRSVDNPTALDLDRGPKEAATCTAENRKECLSSGSSSRDGTSIGSCLSDDPDSSIGTRYDSCDHGDEKTQQQEVPVVDTTDKPSQTATPSSLAGPESTYRINENLLEPESLSPVEQSIQVEREVPAISTTSDITTLVPPGSDKETVQSYLGWYPQVQGYLDPVRARGPSLDVTNADPGFQTQLSAPVETSTHPETSKEE